MRALVVGEVMRVPLRAPDTGAGGSKLRSSLTKALAGMEVGESVYCNVDQANIWGRLQALVKRRWKFATRKEYGGVRVWVLEKGALPLCKGRLG